MTNKEVVDAFIDALLENPECTMQQVRVRLSCSDYELVLKCANALKHFDEERSCPMHTSDKSWEAQCK